jgi:hypothetical protein
MLPPTTTTHTHTTGVSCLLPTPLHPLLAHPLSTPQELGDVRPDVQDAVAKLCCSWWTAEADNREFLVSQALPYLLVRGGG